MGLNESLARITDPYERQARLWPALLALLPLVTMIGLLYATQAPVITNAVTLAASCGALYLLTGLSRELGRRLEPKLFEIWGGKPSTQLLRHRDTTIEKVTKRRYHEFLATKINTPLPDEAQEAQDPKAADEIYQSAVRWLLNHTRDTKTFGLLLQENIAYGFRRNALGLKPLGIVTAVSCATWVLIKHNVFNPAAGYFFSTTALLEMPTTAALSATVSTVMLFVWVGYFTKPSVRTFAFAYAETLLRACDIIPTAPSTRT